MSNWQEPGQFTEAPCSGRSAEWIGAASEGLCGVETPSARRFALEGGDDLAIIRCVMMPLGEDTDKPKTVP